MSKPITFSDADQALMVAVLKQIEVGKVDYEVLRQELNLPTKGAAQVRWSRFNAKIKKSVSANGTPNGTPQKKNSADAGTKEESPTKRAFAVEEGSIETTPRKMPARMKRAKTFKVEVSEDEDSEGAEIEDSEQDDTASSFAAEMPTEGEI